MKKVLSLISFVLVLFCAVNFCFADTTGATQTAEKPIMTDVNYETEIGKSIKKLVDAGIINGIPEPDGTYTYRAYNSVTRAEFCKMVNITFGFNTPAENIFTDINTDKWYYDHALIAIKQGYIKGYGDGMFHGEDTITREQVCTILSRIVNTPTDKTAEITDPVSDWAKDSVINMIALGHVSLEDGGKFRATENMTRGELASALDGFVKEKEVSGEDTNKTEEEKKEDKKEEDGFVIKPVQSGTSASEGTINTGGPSSNRKPSNKDDNEDEEDEEDSSGTTEPDDPDIPQGPTPEEESERIYDLLEGLLYDIEMADGVLFFDEKGALIFGLLTDAADEVVALRSTGFLVTNEYVRSTYSDDIIIIKETILSMTPDERECFETEGKKLNSGIILQLAELFQINLNFGA